MVALTAEIEGARQAGSTLETQIAAKEVEQKKVQAELKNVQN